VAVSADAQLLTMSGKLVCRLLKSGRDEYYVVEY
jgi:hypothetical protein